MKLRRIVVCLVSLVFLVVLSGTVSAATPISGCTIITSPGSYYLTQDIINSTNSTCISITSSDVIFDGAGYTIDGVDSWSTIGLYAYKSTTALTNVTVKNLTMSDWYRGTYYNNVSIGSIDYYTANSNDYYGIAFLYASNININNQ